MSLHWPEMLDADGPQALATRMVKLGIFPTLIAAILFSLLRFSTSTRVLSSLDSEIWMNQNQYQDLIRSKLFPGNTPLSFFHLMHRLHNEASQRARFRNGFIACASLEHLGRSNEPLNNCGSLKFCTGCISTIYCSGKCQKGDWKRGHKFECRRMLRDHNKLVTDGLEISHQARVHYMELIHLWINLNELEGGGGFFDAVHRLKAKYHPSLPQSEFVYIFKTFVAEAGGNHEVVTVDEYRDRARRLLSYSESRYQSLVTHVRNHSDSQLVVFVVNHGSSTWNVLRMAIPSEKAESALFYGMMQPE
ncbi:hypothetical protein BKA70DRAFT_1424096 [Coprinopsis sp. MPI-PUGE-AT-0042]|nr:hypothetical protein BKA70DRAFT_1451686 [Coprinopsis sp. MPI-PUGE-AT-0042]KAH6910436.1 hypothetical protein BKA70DRAFT_1424096 [Coprinopsis sp. MPI-PUGE-AT-0042]